MFQYIKGPSNTAQGPATGDSTEHGDNWHTAVAKINATFKHIESLFAGIPAALSGAPAAVETGIVEHIDDAARKAILDLREEITALQIRLDQALTTAAPPPSPAPIQPVIGATPAPVPQTPAPEAAPPAPEPAPAAPSTAEVGLAAVETALNPGA